VNSSSLSKPAFKPYSKLFPKDSAAWKTVKPSKSEPYAERFSFERKRNKSKELFREFKLSPKRDLWFSVVPEPKSNYDQINKELLSKVVPDPFRRQNSTKIYRKSFEGLLAKQYFSPIKD